MTHVPFPQEFTPGTGQISLVGAGPGAADLLTLRALKRLQEADIVFYDRLIDEEVLALIPPEVEQVNVGKDVGRCKWPQERIDAAIVMAARGGKRVVRLKSGDPSIFGRAAEEIAAARLHGIAVDVIPGVTAASAASASTLTPLTERGKFDRLMMVTATAMTGDLPEDFGRSIPPGTRLAIYMGIHLAPKLCTRLLAGGVSAAAPVTIAQNVAKAGERHVCCTLHDLVGILSKHQIRNPAVIFVDVEHLGCRDGKAAAARQEQAGCAP